jgi:hypothetical protein
MSIEGGLYRLKRLAKRQLLTEQATGSPEKTAKDKQL